MGYERGVKQTDTTFYNQIYWLWILIHTHTRTYTHVSVSMYCMCRAETVWCACVRCVRSSVLMHVYVCVCACKRICDTMKREGKSERKHVASDDIRVDTICSATCAPYICFVVVVVQASSTRCTRHVTIIIIYLSGAILTHCKRNRQK